MKLIIVGILLLASAIVIASTQTYQLYYIRELHSLGSNLLFVPLVCFVVIIYVIHDFVQISKGPNLVDNPHARHNEDHLLAAWSNQPATDSHYHQQGIWRQYLLGLLSFDIGFTVLGRKWRTRRWLEKKARSIPSPYACWAARCWLTQKSEPNFAKALEQLSLSVTREDPAAYGLLGFIYSCPDSPCYDCETAIRYFIHGANNQDWFSRLNLAYCYEHGIGIKEDSQKAQQFYQQVAEQNGQVAAAMRLSLIQQQDPNQLENAYYWAYITMVESERNDMVVAYRAALMNKLLPEQVVNLEEHAKPLLRLLALKRSNHIGSTSWQISQSLNR
ncbi:tetratricopeptide repeat protein [Celerinatantimonas diazotrophica]|uniref:Sel1 repeat-containing protein n=1 Tax=Celerinatantimonas diazotrophica TaxID=412034 RepID=A0A4R1K9N6_9GAMM|nr:sel1 repeat family protein [Celerinatantimonas diazotrophica]TCK61102.1 hypothetical protein EV690_0545 [Celerinatantimonas diazotrophica]CAG9295151.1 hypothetical protein CEDIAZO_00263 [Celerinatantimonas diazotrophica]